MEKSWWDKISEDKPIPEFFLRNPLVFVIIVLIMLFCSFMLIRTIFTFSFDMIYSILGFMNLWFIYQLIQKYRKAKMKYDNDKINK